LVKGVFVLLRKVGIMSKRHRRRKIDSSERVILSFVLLLAILAGSWVLAGFYLRPWVIALATIILVLEMLGLIAFFLTRRRQWLTLALLVTSVVGMLGFCIGWLYIAEY
jgi:hypothetical protein